MLLHHMGKCNKTNIICIDKITKQAARLILGADMYSY